MNVSQTKNSNDKYIKKSTFWNLMASLLSAGMTAILMFFILRINGVEDAGVFSIASALAYQALTVGYFGVRNYQAADVTDEFSFDDYFYFRIFTSLIMYIMIVYYSFFQGYSPYKAAVVFTFSLFKSIDALEDVYHGEYQRRGRLDIGARFQTIRYLISMIGLIFALWMSHNLIFASVFSGVLTLLVFLVQNLFTIIRFKKGTYSFSIQKFKSLLIIIIPLFISSWLNIYILNAGKYAIDKLLSTEMQTYFSTLVLPVFTINLLSTVIYRPYISILSEDWKNGKYKSFKKIFWKQVMIIVLLTAGITAFGCFAGLRLLEIIYGITLGEYMSSFILLLLGGGMNTLAVFFSVIMTIQQKQNQILYGYLISFVFCLLFSGILVRRYLILGASLIYLISSMLIVLFDGLVIGQLMKGKRT